ncbi:MAG: hypothetical protein ACOVOT_14915 [Rubrivivax sp.]
MHTRHDVRMGAVAAALVAMVGAPVLAQSTDPGARVWLQAIGHAAKIESTARIDESFNGPRGTTIDLERDLNQDDRKLVGNLAFGVRLGERWRLELEYLQLRRGGSAALPRAIRFDGVDFAQGAAMTSESRLTYTRVNAGFSLVRSEAGEFGIAFGGASVDQRLTVRGRPANANAGTTERVRSDGVVMPLAGLYGHLKIAPKWRLTGRAYVGSIDNSDGNGAVNDVSAMAVWQFADQLSLGLGWRVLNLRAEPRLIGFIFAVPVTSEFHTRFNGPQVVIEGRF